MPLAIHHRARHPAAAPPPVAAPPPPPHHHPARRRPRRRPAAAAAAGASAAAALLLEVDGAVCDLHQEGHRTAFNAAFKELGYDCVNWGPHVYHDLLGRGDGTGEGLVAAYYETVGWPSFLPTSEQGDFARRVHALKRQQLRRMLAAGAVPLRPDVDRVIRDALAAGARVGWISETLSEAEDAVADSMLTLLAPEVASVVSVFPASLHSRPSSDEADEPCATMERGVAMAAADLKRRQAASFLQALASDAPEGLAAVRLAPHLRLGGDAAAGALTAQWLTAVARLVDVPPASCLVLAANAATVEAAAGAGMVAVAVPRKLAVAGTYPGARAKFEGYGPGYATWPRLAALLPSMSVA